MNTESTGKELTTEEINDKKTRLKVHGKWREQMDASKKRLRAWHKDADQITKRYKGERNAETNVTTTMGGDKKINVFHSNVSTLEAMLYGSVPKVDVSRRYADSSDDIGRVAAETMERLLNLDIMHEGVDVDSTLRATLQDRLIAGLGAARLRYEFEEEDGKLINESAPVDYYYWGDVAWGWARNFAEVPWIGYRNYMTKQEAEKTFGKHIAKELQYSVRTVNVSEEADTDEQSSHAKQAEVWEIWDKASKKVVFYNERVPYLLKEIDDPLKLSNFFPSPEFFLANPTTSLYMPTPDYKICEDQYIEIDVLQTRITILTQAVKAVGAYDSNSEGVQRIFTEGVDNELIPVDSWAAFAEKGGLKGVIDWVPIEAITNALDKLLVMRNDAMQVLQQVSGMADVMQGGLKNQYEGVGQTEIKAEFGSFRVQSLQDQFATFASNLMKIKAEIICKHFSPETIVRKSNMQASPDRDLLPQAMQLLKNPKQAKLSIIIRSESLALVDFQQKQQERIGFMNALSTFMQSSAPLMEAEPTIKPFLLELLQWTIAGFKGSQEIEGVMDRALEAAKKQQQAEQGKPTPEEEQMKRDAQKDQMKLQGEMQKIQAKAQADMQTRQMDMQSDIQTAQTNHQFEMERIAADHEANMRELQLKAQLDEKNMLDDAKYNALQNRAASDDEVVKRQRLDALDERKEVFKASIDVKKEKEKADAKVDKTKQADT